MVFNTLLALTLAAVVWEISSWVLRGPSPKDNILLKCMSVFVYICLQSICYHCILI